VLFALTGRRNIRTVVYLHTRRKGITWETLEIQSIIFKWILKTDFEDGDRKHLAHVRALWLALFNTIMN
jgi:hypothetical protein